jgi:hypothetical protein
LSFLQDIRVGSIIGLEGKHAEVTDSKLIQSNFVVGHQAIFPMSALLEMVDDRHDQVIFFSLCKISREFTRLVILEECPDSVGLFTIHLGGKPLV